ncbi:hypothetical protein GEMRC1_008758 [Eukaryota sp. GEM-RC1]
MNGDLFIKYLQLMFPLTSKAAANRMLLVFDSAPAHRSKKVKAYLKERGFNYVLILGGLTGLLQPADVSWFKPMKATIRNCIEEWLETAPVTTSNRVRAPLANDMAKWMKESLDKLKSEVISKSFQVSFLGPSQTLLISRHPSIRPHLDINSFDALLPYSSSDEEEVIDLDSSSDDDIDDLLQLNNSLNLGMDNDVVAVFD